MENPTSLKGLLGIGKFLISGGISLLYPALAKLTETTLKGGIKFVVKPVLATEKRTKDVIQLW